LQQQLQQSHKLEGIGQLASGIAHDFNNLLTIINGYGELISKRVENDDILYKEISEIKAAGERAAALTEQLLAFSRRKIVRPKVINPNTSIININKMLLRLIGENIKIDTILESNIANIKIDPGQFDQIIMNLVVNARDAMISGGIVTIETASFYIDEHYAKHHISAKPGHYILLSVSDTGEGMNETTKARIFEPFYTTKKAGKGTGLGLSTVYGIVKQANGNIWVYSEPGKGTTFKIYLPVAEGTLEISTKKNLDTKDYKGTETILVVEDDPSVRELTCNFLRYYGYNVIETRDVDHALDVSKDLAGQFSILITDVVMPKMSGHELSRHILAENPGIKILYVTGYTDNSIVHHGILDEGVNLLTKPFGPDDLAKKVREVLDL